MSSVEDLIADLQERLERLEATETPFTDISCRVYNSVSLGPTTTGIAFTLTFDSELWDTDAMHSTSANTGRITCVTPGTYMIGLQIRWQANAVGNRRASILVNGDIVATVFAGNTGAGSGNDQICVTIYELVAGDYIEFTGTQDSGGNLNILKTAADISPQAWAARIA